MSAARSLRRVLQAVCLCGIAGTALAAAPVVHSDDGALRGQVNGDVAAFKGIPFARPPVGALRWRPPQRPVPWHGVRKAAAYGADCMQVPFPGDAAPLGVTPAEDCLYLNVWTPAHFKGRNLPVMVWIYGGGFVNGGSSPPEYDGSAFARDGVVLVSFNYRLGNFGFFAHPALSAEQAGGPLGNYGYMDQIAALRWVQRNVVAFGGDPRNVTVFGESAGGISVNALLTSPLAAGLFQKAVIESGAGRAGLPAKPLSGAADSAEATGVALARSFGIEGRDAAALAKLRAIPAKMLLGNLNMATMGSNHNYVGGPIADGQTEPRHTGGAVCGRKSAAGAADRRRQHHGYRLPAGRFAGAAARAVRTGRGGCARRVRADGGHQGGGCRLQGRR